VEVEKIKLTQFTELTVPKKLMQSQMANGKKVKVCLPCRGSRNAEVSVLIVHGTYRYYEFEVLTAGPMRVGWAKVDCKPGCQIGCDESSWAFDGFSVSL